MSYGLRRIVTFRVLALLQLFVASGASPLVGQEEIPRLLPSSMIPNFDRIRIGQVEGLEGGAFVARTGDASSNWYNPAGLALGERTALNASANAYEYTTISAEGLGVRFGSGRFRSIGTFFGGLIGSPILSGRTVRLGFSFTKPVVWAPGTINGAADYEVSGAVETVISSSKVELSTSVPAIAAGIRLSDDLRLGVGTSLPITSMYTTQQFTDRLLAPTEVSRALRSLQLDAQIFQLQFTGSAQWDLSDAVSLGAVVTSPGLRLGGSGLGEFQAVVGTATGSQDVLFRDTTATFDYRMPLRVVGGVAVEFGRFEVEADVRYYGSIASYDMISSDLPVKIVITDASGIPVSTEQPFRPLREENRAVTNVAVGGNYSFSDSWRLHLGFFTDGTPVGNPDESLFRAVDLTGISGGVSFGGRLSGSLGVSSSWGTTTERLIGPTLGGETAATTVRIQSFYLHYAISYAF